MGFFGKIFGGGGASLESLRKAVAQQRYADARLLAEQLTEQSLAEDETAEIEKLKVVAGDGLAELNLNEALGFQRSGDFEQAAEHLHLALEQVYSTELREKISHALSASPEGAVADDNDGGVGLSSCASCSSQPQPLDNAEDAIFGDDESQLELILTSYPEELAERYLTKGATFKSAFLLSHAGEDEQALPLWQQVDPTDQDDLYWFELGSLHARCGQLEEACTALEAALESNSEFLLAIEALIPVLSASGDYSLAEQRLQQLLEQGIDPAFCYAELAQIYVHQRNFTAAADFTRQALNAGNREPGFIMLAAAVLEHVGALDETEAVLKMLPVAGCGGGVSLPLAEFWLRQKHELGRILDTFNAACREEPDNPRWQLRVAQTYLARNWVKDGVKLLRKVADDPRLSDEMAEEARQLLVEHS